MLRGPEDFNEIARFIGRPVAVSGESCKQRAPSLGMRVLRMTQRRWSENRKSASLTGLQTQLLLLQLPRTHLLPEGPGQRSSQTSPGGF